MPKQVGKPIYRYRLSILHQSDVTWPNLMARHRNTSNVSVQLNGNNLLDKKYYVLDPYDHTYYGKPINGSVSLRVNF